MRCQRRTLTFGATLVGLLAISGVARADERDCVGAIGAQTVDNLRVPEGAACTLEGTVVQGSVKIERAATLEARDIRVIGNVQGEGAAGVVLRSSRVGGSVQVKQGGAAETTGSHITGDIQLDQQNGALRVAENIVGGSVQVVANRGGIAIARNTIDGNLQCKENAPAPAGGGNLVHGNAEDQCAALAGGPGASAPAGSDDDEPVTIRRAATRRDSVAFRGRVAGAGGGVKVLLQVRRSAGWRSLATDRTNARGGYRLVARFADGSRRTLSVRVRVPRQARWASAAVVSDVRRVRVG